MQFLPIFKVYMTQKHFPAYFKGLSKYRRIAFFFLKYLFSFWRYWRFSITQIRSVMTSYCLHLKMVKYWINDISGNIEALFLKLGTINVHHKETKWLPQWCCHSSSFGLRSLSVQKTNIPICNPWNETKGATWNRHSSHIVLTPINRLCGVDGSWFKTKSGNFSFY